ncbi:hypothetical protein DOC35_19405 [Salmonella enterica subsp. enterica]|nr:hypothetical protein [Salmonella enterica subsp. enterica]
MNYEKDLEAGVLIDAAARLLATYSPTAAAPARAILERWQQIAPAYQGDDEQREEAAELIDEIDSGAYQRACDRRTEAAEAKAAALQAVEQLRQLKRQRRERKREIRAIVAEMLDSGTKPTQKAMRAAAGCNGWELSAALKYYKRVRGIA